MPRRPSLQPKPTTKPHAPWVVNLPATLSATGQRERRYFRTRKEAALFSYQQGIRRDNYGTSSTLLPAAKVEEAAVAFTKLAPTGASLIEAVNHYLRWRKAQDASVTFEELFAKFSEAKKHRSQAYRAALRQAPTRFAALSERRVCDITSAEVDDCTPEMSISVRNAFLRVLRAAFNFAIRRGWCGANPISRIEMASLKSRRQILTNEQVVALLNTTIDRDIELLPYQLFCTFAGIRPKEVERLYWRHVNIAEKHVEIPDECSKTETRRIVEMEPVLLQWVSYLQRSGLELEGAKPIVPRRNLRKRLRDIRAASGIEKWPQDAPRRTFASCWLAIHHDVDRLNYLMGHTSPDMLWRHYHRAVTKRQARGFWNINPPPLTRSKIVSIAA